MFKNSSATLLLFLMVLSASGQKKSDQYQLPWIKFNWVKQKLGNKYYDKVAMFIPVKLGNLPNKFEAQFDLGSIASILYGNPILSYQKLMPELQQVNDTVVIKGSKHPVLKDIQLRLDTVSFPHLTLVKLPGFGQVILPDSVNSGTVKTIGTIGIDICKNKVVIIDYPQQRICIIDSLPSALSKKTYFINAKFNSDNRVSIPFKLGDKQEYLMFDTGSSLFPIHTLPKNAAQITDPIAAPIDSLLISIWGKKSTTYVKKINKPMSMGKIIYKNQIVYYSDHAVSSQKFFDDNGIFGFTGNVLFLDKILVIDFRNKKFGIL